LLLHAVCLFVGFDFGGVMAQVEIYLSTDIETDGPVPGRHSMLSLASAAFAADKTLLGTFSVNLHCLDGATSCPDTMAWWQTQEAAWRACREDCQAVEPAMLAYHDWLLALPGRPIFVAYPLAFDYPFVSYYLNRFAPSNPFGFAGIDIRSFIMGMRGKNYRNSSKHYLPKRFFDPLPHTHIALDDALEQGSLFCNLLAEQAAEK